jgi:hypothetical protein
MISRVRLAILSCIFFAGGVVLGQPKNKKCEWILLKLPSYVRNHLEQGGVDLSIPSRKLKFSDLEDVYGENFRKTAHGIFVDVPGARGISARVERSTYVVGDASIEGKLMEISDPGGRSTQWNSFAAVTSADSGRQSTIASDIFIKGIKNLLIPTKELNKAIRGFQIDLQKKYGDQSVVALEVYHVHPIPELVFKSDMQPPVLFPPSKADLEFARSLSLRQPKVIIFFKVLVPNGYEYTVALLNGKCITEIR